MSSTLHLTLLAQAFLLASQVAAFPNGAPACVIRPERIARMGGADTDLGYSIQPSATTFQIGKPLTFTLNGSAQYKGLLMYVEGAANAKVRNGNFVIPHGFKTNKANCDADLIVGANGVITQDTSVNKQPGTKFTWTPDRCEDSVIRAVVVGATPNSWQVLKKVTISCATGARPAKPAGQPSTPANPDVYESGPTNNTTDRYEPTPSSAGGGSGNKTCNSTEADPIVSLPRFIPADPVPAPSGGELPTTDSPYSAVDSPYAPPPPPAANNQTVPAPITPNNTTPEYGSSPTPESGSELTEEEECDEYDLEPPANVTTPIGGEYNQTNETPSDYPVVATPNVTATPIGGEYNQTTETPSDYPVTSTPNITTPVGGEYNQTNETPSDYPVPAPVPTTPNVTTTPIGGEYNQTTEKDQVPNNNSTTPLPVSTPYDASIPAGNDTTEYEEICDEEPEPYVTTPIPASTYPAGGEFTDSTAEGPSTSNSSMNSPKPEVSYATITPPSPTSSYNETSSGSSGSCTNAPCPPAGNQTVTVPEPDPTSLPFDDPSSGATMSMYPE